MKLGGRKFVGKLNGGLNPHILRAVNSGSNQNNRACIVTTQDDMRDMKLRSVHMDMIFDDFAGVKIVAGDAFYSH